MSTDPSASRDLVSSKYGERLSHDKEFHGPVPPHSRTCTDVLCLGVLAAALIAWVVVAVASLGAGNVARLLAPSDSRGRHCGLDAGVRGSPFLLVLEPTGGCSLVGAAVAPCRAHKVCVPKCPTKVFIGSKEFPQDAPLSDLICTDSPGNSSHARKLWDSGKCAKWYLPSRSVGSRCVPFPELPDGNISDVIKNISKAFGVREGEVKAGLEVIRLLTQAEQMGQSVARHVVATWPLLVGLVFVAMVMCAAFIVLLRWCACVLVCAVVLGLLTLLGLGVYVGWSRYLTMGSNPAPAAHDAGWTLQEGAEALLAMRATWLVLALVSMVLLVLVLITLCFLRKRLQLAVGLLSEASKAVAAAPTTLVFPALPWLVQLLVLALAVIVGVHIVASKEPLHRVAGLDGCSCTNGYKEGSECTQKELAEHCHLSRSPLEGCDPEVCAYAGTRTRPSHVYMHVANVAVAVWVASLASAFAEMVLAWVFATWYWGGGGHPLPRCVVVQGMTTVLRYHMGTVALGSMLVTLCRLARLALEWVNHQLSRYKNRVVRTILCAMRCCFWCLERFLRYVNRNAYVMCALHGAGFCPSAKAAFNLLMRNLVRIVVLDKVTDFMLLLGKLLVTVAVMMLAYYIKGHDSSTDMSGGNHSYLLIIILTGVAAYCVCCIFMSVYSMAVETLFLCFLEDCERNDGSEEKPYYMSRQLMKILDDPGRNYR